MLKDLPASLVAAVSQINQKSREAYVEEQKSIEVKKDIKAKHSSMMPKQPAPKADEAAVANARKMAEEINQIDEAQLVHFATGALSWEDNHKKVYAIHKSLRQEHPEKISKHFGGGSSTGYVGVKNKSHAEEVKAHIEKSGGKIVGARHEEGIKEEVNLNEAQLVHFATGAASWEDNHKKVYAIHKSLRQEHPEKISKHFGGGSSTGYVNVKNKSHVEAVKAHIEKSGGKIVGARHEEGIKEEANQIDEKLTDEAKKKIQTALGPKGSQNNMRKTSASARAIIGLAKTNPDNSVKKEEVEGTVPKTPREKELAAKHGNKKLITHGDVMKARGIHKEEIEQADEEHKGVKHLPAKTSPALAAWIGREKFGKKKFQAMAEKGKKQQAEEVEAVEEGLMDTMKKIGKKVVDTIGHKDDKDLLDDLRKKVTPPPAAKAKLKYPMAHDYVKEDLMKMESWDDMMKKVKADSEEEKKSKGTGKFDVKKTTTGTAYTRKSSTFTNGTADKPSAKNEEVETLDEAQLVHFATGASSWDDNYKKVYAIHKSLRQAHPDKISKNFGGGSSTGYVNVKNKSHAEAIKAHIEKSGGKIVGARHEEGIKEEINQIDELSKSTLGSYAKKGALDSLMRFGKASAMSGNKKPDHAEADKAGRRYGGVVKAIDRLTKEEVEVIDEATAVHPKAIHVSDAGGGKYKVHAVGKDFSHGIKVGEHLNDTHLDDFSEMGGKVKMVKPPKKD